MIQQSTSPFKNKKINIVNLMGKISKKEYLDKDCIKIVKDNFNNNS